MTIKDIAAEAGVSKSTVSRVLTRTGYVREDTRQRIIAVMNERGFQPSASARSLSSMTTNTIGVVVPEIWNPFYTEVMQGISELVDEKDLTLIYCNTDNDRLKEEKALRMLEGQRVQGVIFAPSVEYSDKDAEKNLKPLLEKLNAPVVVLDRIVPHMQLDSVIYDNYGAGYCATEELIKAGNKRIAVITGDLDLRHGRRRFEGFRDALRDNKKKMLKKDVFYGDYSSEKAYAISCELFDRGDLPDAMLTSNNLTTLGFLRAMGERNLLIGKDIAMIGIDHIPTLDMIGYRYSCVTRDMTGTGRVAMEALLKRIENPDMKPMHLSIPYHVSLRGSEKRRNKA